MKRALIAAIVAWGSAAHASPLADEMKLAGAADAPIVARIDPNALPAIEAAIRARVPMLLRSSFDHAMSSIAQQLGGDPFTPDGWRALGLDPSKPILIAAGVDHDITAIVAVGDPARVATTIATAKTVAPQLAFKDRGAWLAIDLAGRAEAPSSDRAVKERLRAAPALEGKDPIAFQIDPRLAPVPAAIAPVVSGSFGPLDASIDLRGPTAMLHARWDIVARSALATALATTVDDGLPRPADTPDAILHLHTYFALAALAAAPTHGMTFDLPSRPFLEGDDPPAWIDALAWPYELGATMTHVIGAEPRAKPLFAGARDLALVVSQVGDDLDHSAATAEVAVEPTTAATLDHLIELVWGARTGDTWGTGRIRAFARHLGASADAIGLALRDSAPAYLALARHAPPAPKDLVLELHAAPAALALVDPVAYFAGTLDLAARYDGHALAIDATLSP